MGIVIIILTVAICLLASTVKEKIQGIKVRKNEHHSFAYCRLEKSTLIVLNNGVGVCSVGVDDEITTSASIYSLSVEEEHRRKGYGNRLLEEAENEARRRFGAKNTYLWAEKDKFTASWYQRKGYTPLYSDDKYITLYKELKGDVGQGNDKTK